MNIALPPSRRPQLVVALLTLVAAAVLAAVLSLGGSPGRALADQNPNNIACHGFVQKGNPDADDPTATQVAYTFGCNAPITGYQVQPQYEVQGLETEVFAVDGTTKQVVPTDAFSCFGDIPGYGVNCTGTYGGHYRQVKGSFSIDRPLCAEPRVDPVVTVTWATADATGKVTQYLSGPFDLGRPRGCPRSKGRHPLRIPKVKQDSPY